MGFSFEKILVILFVAAILIGPQQLPKYAAWLGAAVRRIKNFTNDAKVRLQDEMGEDAIDWKDLDPRQYDPRRIIRDALVEDDGLPPVEPVASVAAVPFVAHTHGVPAPFDAEAT